MVGPVSVPVRLAVVLTIGFPAAAFATNCYVLAPGAGQECLVVDPGIGVEDQLAEVLREHRLKPAAVLLTHGHLDHVYSVTPVCGARLRRRATSTATTATGSTTRCRCWTPRWSPCSSSSSARRRRGASPTTSCPWPTRTPSSWPGSTVRVLHAPGHTEGSVMFALPTVPDGVADSGLGSTVLSGDVLFAGSIGRTDLPGGDRAAMLRSLRDKVLPLPDDIVVLPGHGAADHRSAASAPPTRTCKDCQREPRPSRESPR